MGKMMKNILKKLARDEEGQAFILVLIFLLVGGLIIAPLLGFMSTGLLAGQMHEEKMDELYAADAGVEDALYKIKSDDALLQDLDVGEESDPYYLTVNDLEVSYTVTKLSLLETIVDPSEYKEDRPHEDWMGLETPAGATYDTDGNGDYVEYLCNITFDYAGGVGNRQVQSIGIFFYPFSGSVSLISPPVYDPDPVESDIEYVLVVTRDYLVGDEPELNVTSSGFAFIWRWQSTPSRGPIFWSDDTGGITFSFRVYNDPDWLDPDFEVKYFGWALVKEEDISYVSNAPGSYNWLIEATAGDTEIRSVVLDDEGILSVRAWEINPQ